jgi:hypothetical protein
MDERQRRLAQDLVERARAEGTQVVSDGLLTRLTKSVLEAALSADREAAETIAALVLSPPRVSNERE